MKFERRNNRKCVEIIKKNVAKPDSNEKKNI